MILRQISLRYEDLLRVLHEQWASSLHKWDILAATELLVRLFGFYSYVKGVSAQIVFASLQVSNHTASGSGQVE